VNVHLHCIASNLKRIGKIFTLTPPAKFSADDHGCTDFDLILGSYSMVLFGSILLSHSKTVNAQVISFLILQYMLKVVIKKLYNFDV